jgi:alkanesulfonate monooxygenase SsuD/methylene tetrahydromethanopterin reductase-like flavin-dependent oxidoreductase (luciferase family)
MRYALSLPIGGVCSDPRVLAELAGLAEQSGWDGVFLEDYIVYQKLTGEPTGDPWVALAAMALRTERIRLGTMVTPLSRRRPWKVAREAVSVDQLSNGRLILGVGLGDSREAGFARLNEVAEARSRAERLDEALDVLVGLWSGQPFSYVGRHYQVQDLTFLPKPVQQPRIPIWVGGGWPLKAPAERAARWDGACLYKHPGGVGTGEWEDMSPEDVRSLRALVESRRGGAVSYDIAVGGRQRGPDWEQERNWIQSVAAAGATWWTEWLPPAELDVMRANVQRGPLRAAAGHAG